MSGIKSEDIKTLKRVFFIVAFVLTFIWLVVMGVLSLDAWSIHNNADGYQKKTFVVGYSYYSAGSKGSRTRRTTSVRVGRFGYRESAPRRHGSGPRWYAEGEVDGAEEKFSLKGALPRRPKSQEDLESMVSTGARLEVWYNPEQPKDLRVLDYEEDRFAHTYARAMLPTVAGFIPMVALCVTVVALKIRSRRQSPEVAENPGA